MFINQSLQQALAAVGLQIPNNRLTQFEDGGDSVHQEIEDRIVAVMEHRDRLAAMCDADAPAHMDWKTRRDMYNEVYAETFEKDARE